MTFVREKKDREKVQVASSANRTNKKKSNKIEEEAAPIVRVW